MPRSMPPELAAAVRGAAELGQATLSLGQSPRAQRPDGAPATAPDVSAGYIHSPAETRDYLSACEAMALAGTSFGTLAEKRKHGLLPDTRWLNRAQALYSRSDHERVMAGPRTGRGVDQRAVLASIRGEALASERF